MAESFSIFISILSLAVSSVTAWLTLFRRGTVRMTQPTTIFFGPDGSRSQGDNPLPKIYLRTLLFSTSKRGRIVESMHVALSRNETHQNFNIWVYGESEKLVRGSGIFVGEMGIAANHHFLAPKDENGFRFLEGKYTINVFAKLLGDRKSINIFSQQLEISHDKAVKLEDRSAGLYFDWGPDSSFYLSHIDKKPPSSFSENYQDQSEEGIFNSKDNAFVDKESKNVTEFTIYREDGVPGLHLFKRVSPIRWENHRPDRSIWYFDMIRKTNVGSFHGIELRSKMNGLSIFVPNIGSIPMQAKIIIPPDPEWQLFGEMTNVR